MPLLRVARMNTPTRTPPAPPTPPAKATPPRIAADAAWIMMLAPIWADAVARLSESSEPANAAQMPERQNTMPRDRPTRAPAATATRRLLPVTMMSRPLRV
ncbi:hypothetical protein D9M68_776610 [compost metagenome]